jgi:hypothetical protein
VPFVSEYKCTECDAITPREELTVKRVVFRQMGEFGRTLKGRVVGWLCPDCRDKDAVWLDQSTRVVESTSLTRRKKPKDPAAPLPEPDVVSVAPLHPVEVEPLVPFPV